MNGAGRPYVVLTTQSPGLADTEKPDSVYTVTGTESAVRPLKVTVTLCGAGGDGVVPLPVQAAIQTLRTTKATASSARRSTGLSCRDQTCTAMSIPNITPIAVLQLPLSSSSVVPCCANSSLLTTSDATNLPAEPLNLFGPRGIPRVDASQNRVEEAVILIKCRPV